MTGKPVFAASEREKVLFPDPAIPVTRTRRPISKAASLIDVVSVSAVSGASTGRKQQRIRAAAIPTHLPDRLWLRESHVARVGLLTQSRAVCIRQSAPGGACHSGKPQAIPPPS